MRKRVPIIRIGRPKPKDRKPKVVGGGEIGSVWSPGVSDGSWLWPDSARVRLEKGSDGVTRPVRD